MLQIHGKNEGKMLQGLEKLIYEIDLSESLLFTRASFQ